MIERIKKLEEKIIPEKIPRVDVIIWKKYLGETKDEAILRYKKENNVKKFEMIPIIVCVKSDEEIREEHSKKYNRNYGEELDLIERKQ